MWWGIAGLFGGGALFGGAGYFVSESGKAAVNITIVGSIAYLVYKKL